MTTPNGHRRQPGAVTGDDGSEARGLLRSAAALALGRQAGALVFMGAVCLLPAISRRGVVDDFLWAYFATLFLTSILNFGLERVVARVVAASAVERRSTAVSPVLAARMATLPVGAVALWALLAAVHVSLSWPAFLLCLGWVAAIQLQGVAFAGLRAVGGSRLETPLVLMTRVVEAAFLLALAAGGSGIVPLLAAMASLETGATVVALRALGSGRCTSWARVAALPWTSIAAYTAVEFLAFAYLRVDAVLVGHLLGASAGATYSLVYRAIDALTGMVTPLLLLLIPLATGKFVRGESLAATRGRVLTLLPLVGVVLGLATMFGSGLAAAVVPRFDEGVEALRLLVIAVPLVYFSAIELHLRSAEDRNREVVAVGAGVLVVNVALNLLLIPRYGLAGAGWALVLSELLQVVAVLATAGRRNGVVLRSGAAALAGATGLLAVALPLNSHRLVAAYGLAAALVAAGVVALRPSSLHRRLAPA